MRDEVFFPFLLGFCIGALTILFLLGPELR